MNKLVLAALLIALTAPALAAGDYPLIIAPVYPLIIAPVENSLLGVQTLDTFKSCINVHNAIRLCQGDPPTIWMSPDMQPRDVAAQFLDAMRSLGLKLEVGER